MPKLDDLGVFIKIVEAESISSAARMLHMSPSAVSRRLSRLEGELKFRLFSRSTHHLSLTAQGTIVYNHCLKGLTEIEQGIAHAEDASERISGTLKVHALLGVGESVVAPAIIDFVTKHPDVSIELEVSDASVNLLERKLDVSIRGRNFTEEGLGSVTSLSYVDLFKAPYAICASPDYIARSKPLQAPADLKLHNCLIHATQMKPDEWWFADGKKEYKIKVVGNFVSNNGLAIREAAVRGLGIARLALYRVSDDIRRNQLRAYFTNITKSNRSVRAYYPRTTRPPANLRAFLTFLRRRLSSPDDRARLTEVDTEHG